MSRTYTISPDPFLVVLKDDDSGVVMKRSRVKAAEMPKQTPEDLQLTLPLHQIPIQ